TRTHCHPDPLVRNHPDPLADALDHILANIRLFYYFDNFQFLVKGSLSPYSRYQDWAKDVSKLQSNRP
ncbi:hypothetical protein L9F63_018162, partial [Diploptera punctata]